MNAAEIIEEAPKGICPCAICLKKPLVGKTDGVGHVIFCPECRNKNGWDFYSAQTFPWNEIESAVDEWQQENTFVLQ